MGMEFGDTAEEFYRRNQENFDRGGTFSAWAKTMLEEIFEALRESNLEG